MAIVLIDPRDDVSVYGSNHHIANSLLLEITFFLLALVILSMTVTTFMYTLLCQLRCSGAGRHKNSELL
jgi:hypothetical protein